jgi:hypothetical protein
MMSRLVVDEAPELCGPRVAYQPLDGRDVDGAARNAGPRMRVTKLRGQPFEVDGSAAAHEDGGAVRGSARAAPMRSRGAHPAEPRWMGGKSRRPTPSTW